ncbi:murein biosynthesis integral membrane protein MurJ [Thermosipho ferrireducens]|uniref:Probable lipid II flippase MurJ n=1 Tax=Thermosipho ferrireducens TaxID=2571116 RepID=A0ABX7S745_9BACT|nr:murein biosynthesis integral membrane protein MurJ [Thermosipho ferrireducens]QTA37671.1 murein biosynthesis integral membrane protein MurJ [Thermosipho ferrireducens]
MSIFTSSLLFATATFFSRILGLVRDVLFAKYFGASYELDAYFIAIMFPYFLRRVFAEGAMTSAFVPLYSEFKDKEEKDKFVSSIINGFTIIILSLLIIVFLYPGIIPAIFGSGASFETKNLASKLSKITSPFIFFIFLWAISYSIANTHGRFFWPALTPAFANITIISGILLSKNYGILAPSLGFLSGGILMFVSLSKILLHHKYYVTLKYFKNFLKLFLPSFFAMTISQINTIVDMNIASFYGTGGVSYLQYASRFYMLPYGLFAVSVSTVVLPKIASDRDNFSAHLKNAMSTALFFTFPATLGLIVLSTPIIRFFYEHGQFTGKDTIITSSVLVGYSLGLPFYGLYSTLSRANHAIKNMKTPFFATILVALINIILDVILGLKYGPTGIAIATSIAGAAGFVYLFTRTRVFPIKDSVKIAISSGIMIMVVIFTNKLSSQKYWLFFTIGTGTAIYFVTSFILFRKRIWSVLNAWRKNSNIQ